MMARNEILKIKAVAKPFDVLIMIKPCKLTEWIRPGL